MSPEQACFWLIIGGLIGLAVAGLLGCLFRYASGCRAMNVKRRQAHQRHHRAVSRIDHRWGNHG